MPAREAAAARSSGGRALPTQRRGLQAALLLPAAAFPWPPGLGTAAVAGGPEVVLDLLVERLRAAGGGRGGQVALRRPLAPRGGLASFPPPP